MLRKRTVVVRRGPGGEAPFPGEVAGMQRFEIAREKALARLRALKRPLPKSFRFDRNEANDR